MQFGQFNSFRQLDDLKVEPIKLARLFRLFDGIQLDCEVCAVKFIKLVIHQLSPYQPRFVLDFCPLIHCQTHAS